MRDVTPTEQDEYALSSSPGKPMKKEKPEPVYPRVEFDLTTLPEAKKWKVGDTYKVELEVKMVGLHVSSRSSDYSNRAEFEVRKIGAEEAEGEKQE